MRLELLGFLLLFGVCFAGHDQRIDDDEGIIVPEWYDTAIEESIIEYDDIKPSFYSHEWNPLITAQKDEVEIKLNKGVDKVLSFIREAFSSIGEIGIPLPEINKPFGHPPFSGQFKASSGYFKNPATLERTGDVEIIVKNYTTIILQVQLGFKQADAGFGKYSLDILHIHQEGNIKVSVTENSVKLMLTLTYAPVCTFHLDELKFDKLSGIKVDINGLGVFQTMFNELSQWLISNFESTFRDVVNKKLYNVANLAIANKDICKYFPQ